jgi:Spy/CpxP family protein refolding chaperone
MRKTALVLAVLALLLSAALVWGQAPPAGRTGPGGTGGGRGGFMMGPAMAVPAPTAMSFDRMFGQLQLTDDQTTKIKDILTKSDTAMTPLAQKSTDATQALRTALLAPTMDSAKVKGLATAAETAEAAVIDARIQTWTAVRGILTADQLTKLQESMNAPRGGMGGNGPGGGGNRGGNRGGGGGNAPGGGGNTGDTTPAPPPPPDGN